ncbi:hypothetical protein PPTG_07265 [Phytophthora nicotianae INRA-310]|uniref:PiggyBac transposable element-derived protein domain-containing protein n=1 Tax=Phytophthora nicotianae (strain INRA-310) TaxID=761204 RepID=W2QRC7_PHYN3|nr:hypothetical protein PPTG_07265 [Phytophthora nicotianae INRA-310]ETN15059.1 hypothetical protein PPTG_07265 [Phytophthora nicotianae INRA-310]
MGESAVLEYYANMLRARSRTPRPTNPGDAEIAPAAHVVRETYGALIVGTDEPTGTSATLVPSTAGPPVIATVPETSAGSPATPERGRHTSRSARRSLATTESPMASTPPPRPVLIATSPHVSSGSTGSIDEHSGSDVEAPTDDASAESAEEGSEYEPDSNEGGDCSQEAFSNELLDDNDDTLNDIGDGDEATAYGAMDSGDDAEKDDLDDGEDSDEGRTDTFAIDDGPEPEPTEPDFAAEELFAERFLDSCGGEDQVLAEPDTFEYLTSLYQPVNNTQSYPGLRKGYSAPTGEALRNADSPLALFFFFMPVALWQHIAVCSNDYGREMAPLRLDEPYKQYCSKQRLNPDLPKKTKREIRTEMEGS